MKTSKSDRMSAMAARVSAQLKFELDMAIGSSAEQAACLDAYMAMRFPPRKSPLRVSPTVYSFAATAVAIVAPIASLAGLLFAGMAL